MSPLRRSRRSILSLKIDPKELSRPSADDRDRVGYGGTGGRVHYRRATAQGVIPNRGTGGVRLRDVVLDLE